MASPDADADTCIASIHSNADTLTGHASGPVEHTYSPPCSFPFPGSAITRVRPYRPRRGECPRGRLPISHRPESQPCPVFRSDVGRVGISCITSTVSDSGDIRAMIYPEPERQKKYFSIVFCLSTLIPWIEVPSLCWISRESR